MGGVEEVEEMAEDAAAVKEIAILRTTLTFPRRITDKYCHTHGGCNHVYRDFTRKAEGYNDAAMMQNYLGGLNACCQLLAQA